MGYVGKCIRMMSGFRCTDSWGSGGYGDLAKADASAMAGAQQGIPKRFGPLASRGPFVTRLRPEGGDGGGHVEVGQPRLPARRPRPLGAGGGLRTGRVPANYRVRQPRARGGAGPRQDRPPLMNMKYGCGPRALGLAGAVRGGGVPRRRT